jgi:hypothetical protein
MRRRAGRNNLSRAGLTRRGGGSALEELMHTSSRLTVAALALLSSVSLAAAMDNKPNATENSSTSTTGMGDTQNNAMTEDSLSLTKAQQKLVWEDISKTATKDKAPSGFTAKIGDAIPASLSTHPVPVTTANVVPKVRTYNYAMLDNKLLIVNPDDKKIVQIISQQ